MFIKLIIVSETSLEETYVNVDQIVSFGSPRNGPPGAMSIVKLDNGQNFFSTLEPSQIQDQILNIQTCVSRKS